jgi:hypothetical protein
MMRKSRGKGHGLVYEHHSSREIKVGMATEGDGKMGRIEGRSVEDGLKQGMKTLDDGG